MVSEAILPQVSDQIKVYVYLFQPNHMVNTFANFLYAIVCKSQINSIPDEWRIFLNICNPTFQNCNWDIQVNIIRPYKFQIHTNDRQCMTGTLFWTVRRCRLHNVSSSSKGQSIQPSQISTKVIHICERLHL